MIRTHRGPWSVVAGTALLVCCQSQGDRHDPTGKLALEQADDVVREYVAASLGPIDDDDELSLIELTTPVIWSRLGVQVYTIGPDAALFAGTSFVIQGGEAHALGSGQGQHEVLSLAVCDIDQDGRDELAYSYSWGAGIHRTEFGLWKPHAPDGERNSTADCAFIRGDVRIQSEPDGPPSLHVASFRAPTDWGPDQAQLGHLQWKNGAPDPLRVILSANLSPRVRKQVWTH